MVRKAVLTILVCVATSICQAQQKASHKKPKRAKGPAVIDPSQADADFKIQGEYAGTVNDNRDIVPLGIQVIALSKGAFHAVAYAGGLPGAGWSGREKIEADGKIENGVVTFVSDRGSGILANGGIVVKSNDGTEMGRLSKVIRKSPTLGKRPPRNAIVLFDGTTADNFEGGRMTDDGLLMEGVTSHRTFQSCQLHLEFLLSYMPESRGQGRSNSGCYLQGRYEVQILDSFGLEGKNNECGGIYEISDPAVNMCFPPLTWQTYDIDYTAAQYDAAGKKTANARLTVRHNGVLVQKDVEVPRVTRAAKVPEGPEPGPLYLQNHGNPVRFRNIWIVERP